VLAVGMSAIATDGCLAARIPVRPFDTISEAVWVVAGLAGEGIGGLDSPLGPAMRADGKAMAATATAAAASTRNIFSPCVIRARTPVA
jgi:hypothetical protein